MGRPPGCPNRTITQLDHDLEGVWSRRSDGGGGLETCLGGYALRVQLAAKGSYLGEIYSASGRRILAIRFPKASEAKEFLLEWTMSLNGRP